MDDGPIKARRIYWIRPYTLRFKGNTLVDISPRDENVKYPLYLREKYFADKAPMKQVTRYIAPYSIKWYADRR
jgi:hypothetical protein